MFGYVVLKDLEGQTISRQCGCRLALSTLEKPFKGLPHIAEEDVLSLEHADNLNLAGDSPDMKAVIKCYDYYDFHSFYRPNTDWTNCQS